jgi:hypothetical protein
MNVSLVIRCANNSAPPLVEHRFRAMVKPSLTGAAAGGTPSTAMPDPTKLTAAFIKSGTYRRDGLTVYGAVDPARAALLVMNLQNAWLAPGAPFSPPGDTSTRAILGAALAKG